MCFNTNSLCRPGSGGTSHDMYLSISSAVAGGFWHAKTMCACGSERTALISASAATPAANACGDDRRIASAAMCNGSGHRPNTSPPAPVRQLTPPICTAGPKRSLHRRSKRHPRSRRAHQASRGCCTEGARCRGRTGSTRSGSPVCLFVMPRGTRWLVLRSLHAPG